MPCFAARPLIAPNRHNFDSLRHVKKFLMFLSPLNAELRIYSCWTVKLSEFFPCFDAAGGMRFPGRGSYASLLMASCCCRSHLCSDGVNAIWQMELPLFICARWNSRCDTAGCL